jgi:hypothetical protein
VGELITGKELKRLEVITVILRSLSKFLLANRYFKDLTRMDTTTEVTDNEDMIVISNVRNVGILT